MIPSLSTIRAGALAAGKPLSAHFKEQSAMSPAKKALIVFVVAMLGAWGCAQGPTNGSASAERIRALESKISKLETDFRAVVAAREELRKKLTAADEDRAKLAQKVEELQSVVKEREDLKQQLLARTSERDNAQNQVEQFRKGLKTLLGQMETAAPTSQPVSVTVDAVAPGKS
jgi:DNA repair exonuclease SbcCD ATPase subunit